MENERADLMGVRVAPTDATLAIVGCYCKKRADFLQSCAIHI